MMSANTNNFVVDRYYTYVPGSGNKTEAVCQASADSYHSYCMTTEECIAANATLTETSDFLRCEQFKGGDLNPYGEIQRRKKSRIVTIRVWHGATENGHTPCCIKSHCLRSRHWAGSG
jgi:hypothetical protein